MGWMARKRVLVVVLACTAVGIGGAVVQQSAVGASSSWAIQPTPSGKGALQSTLDGVSCPSPTSCTAVGHDTTRHGAVMTLAEHWDGARWTVQATPHRRRAFGSYLTGVSCPTARSCTAVGYYTAIGEPSGGVLATLALHWDGYRWTIQPTPSPFGAFGSYLTGVSCPSARSCTAVGYYTAVGGASGGVLVTLAEHWDGVRWTVQATPSQPGVAESYLTGVSCPAARSCTAVGYYTAIGGASGGVIVTLAEHWDGSDWTIQPMPGHFGVLESYLTGVSCTAARSCTAVGYKTEIGGASGGVIGTLAEHWDGRRWAVQPTPVVPGARNSYLIGASCPRAKVCTAVGTFAGQQGITVTLAERSPG